MSRKDGFAIGEVTYLNVSFQEKDEAKALGARWNPERRQWYIPPGLDVALFQQWLPVGHQLGSDRSAEHLSSTPPQPPVPLQEPESDYQLSTERASMRLSQLLGGVAGAISRLYRDGVWTQVEVVNAQLRGQHVFLELSERDAQGNVIAQARAAIWANVARTLLPRFEQETGVQLAPGIKLLVRAQPSFHMQYGFSLFINDIDPQYTLGDLAAKKREIINRLKQEGIFNANRSLAAPWNYHRVLVVSPEQAAGLGDFQADAQHLQAWGLCEFIYVYARFQGEGAAAAIRQTMLTALEEQLQLGQSIDAVVIIRGGGAVNDLAWLNDYELAKAVCELSIPVLVGVGHERDHTVLDDIANQPFDTPSKVIAGIRQVIEARVHEVKLFFEDIQRMAQHQLYGYGRKVEQDFTTLQLQANQALVQARAQIQKLIELSRHRAQGQLNEVRGQIPAYLMQVQTRSKAVLDAARSDVHHIFDRTVMHSDFSLRRSREQAEQQIKQIARDAHYQVTTARRQTLDLFRDVHQNINLQRSREQVAQHMKQITQDARHQIMTARQITVALFREVIGQKPDKTLARGFALVHDAHGKVVTNPANLQVGQEIEIEFKKGRVAAQVTQIKGAE